MRPCSLRPQRYCFPARLQPVCPRPVLEGALRPSLGADTCLCSPHCLHHSTEPEQGGGAGCHPTPSHLAASSRPGCPQTAEESSSPPTPGLVIFARSVPLTLPQGSQQPSEEPPFYRCHSRGTRRPTEGLAGSVAEPELPPSPPHPCQGCAALGTLQEEHSEFKGRGLAPPAPPPLPCSFVAEASAGPVLLPRPFGPGRRGQRDWPGILHVLALAQPHGVPPPHGLGGPSTAFLIDLDPHLPHVTLG